MCPNPNPMTIISAYKVEGGISFFSCMCSVCLSLITNPRGRLKWPYAVTRLTAHFMCGLMSDLVICKFRKSMVIHDVECPYWDQVSLNNTNQPISSRYLKSDLWIFYKDKDLFIGPQEFVVGYFKALLWNFLWMITMRVSLDDFNVEGIL